MPTRFLLRKKATLHGWQLQRSGAGEMTFQDKPAAYEGYVVTAPGGEQADVNVVRLEDDVAAERYAADIGAKPMRAVDGKYVLYMPDEHPSTFTRTVFEVFRRPP
jgi:hypothetical protein